MAGITGFAVTAALALATLGIDLFSTAVLGITAAVGGTVRHLVPRPVIVQGIASG